MNNNSNQGERSFIDELTYTLEEFNKAMGNIQYMAGTIKELDLAGLLKGKSKSNLMQLLKNIDLKQISSVLQSPLVQQLLSDPEFLALLAPDVHQHAQPQQQSYPGTQQQALPQAYYNGIDPNYQQQQARSQGAFVPRPGYHQQTGPYLPLPQQQAFQSQQVRHMIAQHRPFQNKRSL